MHCEAAWRGAFFAAEKTGAAEDDYSWRRSAAPGRVARGPDPAWRAPMSTPARVRPRRTLGSLSAARVFLHDQVTGCGSAFSVW